MSEHLAFSSRNEHQTKQFGAAIGRHATAGQVIALSGPLGSGKTCLVKGVTAGLEVKDQRTVNSPSYVLINEYEGRLHVYHIDAYRLASAMELEALGFDEILNSHGLVIIEWADRVSTLLPDDTLAIQFEPSGRCERSLNCRSTGVVSDALLQAVARSVP